jgi:hypothetical protein
MSMACRHLSVKLALPSIYLSLPYFHSNVHVFLSLPPPGDSFRVRCRMFPSLINCTTIDWFDKWPYDALLGVSSRFLAEGTITIPMVK